MCKIIAVYDNGGDTADRYTVYTNELYSNDHTTLVCLGMSDNPAHRQGFSQFSSGNLGMHNGTRIDFTDLPENVQVHALERLQISS